MNIFYPWTAYYTDGTSLSSHQDGTDHAPGEIDHSKLQELWLYVDGEQKWGVNVIDGTFFVPGALPAILPKPLKLEFEIVRRADFNMDMMLQSIYNWHVLRLVHEVDGLRKTQAITIDYNQKVIFGEI